MSKHYFDDEDEYGIDRKPSLQDLTCDDCGKPVNPRNGHVVSDSYGLWFVCSSCEYKFTAPITENLLIAA